MSNTSPPTFTVASKPLVGISGCLAGQKVRYDGKSQLSTSYHTLSKYLSFRSFCPEAEAGLGVPRPPVQLVETNQEINAIGVNDRSLDVTTKLIAISKQFSIKHSSALSTNNQRDNEFLAGYIFKSRSPSCGLFSTPIFDSVGNIKRVGSGLFAREMTHQHLAFTEETTLISLAQQAIFISACYLSHSFLSGESLDNELADILSEASDLESRSKISKMDMNRDKQLENLLTLLSNPKNKKTALKRRFLCKRLQLFWQL